jgi:hypothetical protein
VKDSNPTSVPLMSGRGGTLDHMTQPPSPTKPDLPRPVDGIKYQVRDLPADVAQARLLAAADDAANEKVAGPRIAAVLTVCKLVAQELERLHQGFADRTDLDLTGYSRASAIWLLSGRILGLHRALLVQVEAGVCNEAMVTGRAIHEASRVLFAFGVPDADDLVRVWLNDQGRHGYVKQRPARDAQARYEAALDEAMQRAGLPGLPSPIEAIEELYDKLSRPAHNRRSSCVDSVWEPGRRMAYGYNPSAIRRAGTASWAASMTGEVLNSVGDGLRALYSRRMFFVEEIVPLQQSLEAVRVSAPLDERTIREAAGTLHYL